MPPHPFRPARPARPSRPPRLRRRASLVAAGAVIGGAVFAPAAAADEDEVAFRIGDPRITESSGLAVSARHDGVVYTHNDSGGVPQIFALGPDGRTRAVLTIGGARARDWEAMAVGEDERGRPAIFVADIGDNLGGAWPHVTLYRVPEPRTLRSRTLTATEFRLRYEDGPRNAEAMMINPRTNRVYVVSKLFGGKVYEAPANLRTSGYNTLRKVADAPAIATGAAFSPDGRTCVIRTYFGATVYEVGADGRPGERIGSVPIPRQEQGEAITYTADGRSVLVSSEGADQPVHRVPLPEEALPAPERTPDDGSGNTQQEGQGAEKVADEDGRRDASGPRLGLFLALAIAGTLGYGWWRSRRGRT
ncbi:lactonase family protein [Actinomadura sediminis]|uniref:WD40 repeat domain-containing protein n=1 Tax=Actinomadura sediminis TaxID=1038904 RepID=A0ABW3ENX5_9ACTN